MRYSHLLNSPSTAFLLLFLLLLFTVPTPAENFSQRLSEANISIHTNGLIAKGESDHAGNVTTSPNGIFKAVYTIGEVSHDFRELRDLTFYENNRLLFTMSVAPGSDLYVSNSGLIAFMNMMMLHERQAGILFFDKHGEQIFSEFISGAALFGFSETGNKFAVGNTDGLHVFDPTRAETDVYPPADQFDISPDEKSVAIAKSGKVTVFREQAQILEFETGFLYPRAIALTSDREHVAVIDKRNLIMARTDNGKVSFRHTLTGSESYRDLHTLDELIAAGVHRKDPGVSQGILQLYDTSGLLKHETTSEIKNFDTFERNMFSDPGEATADTIPWPFFPFDSMHTVWNYYEQHMGLGTSSYMHQGLDIITPIDEPTYAVTDGVVKLVLTLGGDVYWRIATSPESVPGWSRGWLYAHLVESSIQFDVGDTVQVHDYLGDIINWSGTWGHIHFVEIEDSGMVWYYDDNEWGITFNPLISLRTNEDLIPPVLEPVFEDSKFAFTTNETSDYLDPDSLFGQIDIICKVVDYIGESEWQQPAFECYYWVKSVDNNEIAFERMLGRRLNHSYGQYDYTYYIDYAPLIYKRDGVLPPSSWNDQERNYYHILTNNDGDTLIDLSEANLAFNTTDYPDGNYRIFIEVFDQYGNVALDSQDVVFDNYATGIDESTQANQFALHQNYPNPFNPTTVIQYQLPTTSHITLNIYDISGRLTRKLVNGTAQPGTHEILWDGTNDAGQPVVSGIYFYRLTYIPPSTPSKVGVTGDVSSQPAHGNVQTRKMLLVR